MRSNLSLPNHRYDTVEGSDKNIGNENSASQMFDYPMGLSFLQMEPCPDGWKVSNHILAGGTDRFDYEIDNTLNDAFNLQEFSPALYELTTPVN